MKKHWFWKILGIIAIAIVIFFIVIWFLRVPIISSYLSSKLKVSVSMQNISISSTQIQIDQLRIKNPSRIKQQPAFSSKKIAANYSLEALRQERAIIDSIIVENSYLSVLCFNPFCSENNWSEIMKKIASEQDKEKVEGKKYLIKKLILKDFTVEVRGAGGLILPTKTKKRITISYLEFNNISSETGFPTQELFTEIFKQAGLKEYIKDVIETPQNIIKKIIPPFKIGQNEQENVEESLIVK